MSGRLDRRHILRSPARNRFRREIVTDFRSKNSLGRTLHFEPLEDRRLLAATLLSSQEANALRDSVAALEGFGARLQSFGELGKALPLQTSGVGDFVKIEDAYRQVFVNPVQNYLSQSTVPRTVEALQTAVQQATGNVNSISSMVSPATIQFTIDHTLTRVVPVEYDLPTNVPAEQITIQSKLAANLNFTLHIQLTFGIERSDSATATPFVEFVNEQNTISASITPDNTPIPARVGFLGVSLRPTASLNLSTSFDTVNQRVYLKELAAPLTSSLVTSTHSGVNSFNLTLPISTSLAGVNVGSSKVEILDTNLFDANPAVVTVDASALAKFRNVSASSLFNGLQQLQNTLDSFGAFDETLVPFTGGTKLSQVVPLGEAIGAKITGLAADAKDNSLPGFVNAQEFATKVARSTRFDAPNSEIVFDVSFNHNFAASSLPMDVSGKLGDLLIKSQPQLNVRPSLLADMEIVVQLVQPGATAGIVDTTSLASIPGVSAQLLADKNELKVILRDGTSAEIDLSNVTNIGGLNGLISALESPSLFANKLDVQYDRVASLTQPGTFFNQGLLLFDNSTPIDSTSEFKVEMLNGSLAGAALGIIGTGHEGIKLAANGDVDLNSFGIQSSTLHGQSAADFISIRPKSSGPMFTATASLSANIGGAAQFGFVDIGINNGTAVGTISASFRPTDSDGKLTLTDAFKASGDKALRVQANKPVAFLANAYNGNVRIEIRQEDASLTVINIPFSIPKHGENDAASLTAIVAAMNSQSPAGLIRVSQSGGKLEFTLTDGISRRVVVKADANSTALKNLGITSDISRYVVNPKLNAAARFNLPYSVNMALPGYAVQDITHSLKFEIRDLTKPDINVPGNISLDLPALGEEINRLKNLDMASFIDGLQHGVDLIQSVFRESELFKQSLPGLDASLNRALDIPAQLASLVKSLKDNPASGLGQLDETFTQLFGLPVVVSLDTTRTTPALRFDLAFDIGQTLGATNLVTPFKFKTPVSVDLNSLNVSGVSRLLDVRGSAPVELETKGQINLALGFELSNQSAPVPFLYDNGTSLNVLAKAAATGLKFDASLGAIGVTFTGGTVNLNNGSGGFAQFNVGLFDNNNDGRHSLVELTTAVQNGLRPSDFRSSGDVNVSVQATLDFSGLAGATTLNATLTDHDLSDGVGSLVVGANVATAVNNAKLAMSSNFNLLSVVGGWNSALDLMIGAMDTEVFNAELPFIGNQLKERAGFLRDIKSNVADNLADNAENLRQHVYANPYQDVREDLFDALGTNGINLLKDVTGDGQVSMEDIVVKQLNPGIGFQILLGNDLGAFELPFDFKLDIPGLDLDLDAKVSGRLHFDMALTFGVDLSHGFFIDTRDSYLNVFVDLGVPGLKGSGRLGVMRLEASEWLKNAVATLGEVTETNTNSQVKITSLASGSAGNFEVRVINNPAMVAGGETYTFNPQSRILELTVNTSFTKAKRLAELINTDSKLKTYFVATNSGNGEGAVQANPRVLGVSGSGAVATLGDITEPNSNSNVTITSLAQGSASNFEVRVIDNPAMATNGETYKFDAQTRNLELTIKKGATKAQRLAEFINNNSVLKNYFVATKSGDGEGFVQADPRVLGVANSFAGRFNVAMLDAGQNDGLLTLSEMQSVRSAKEVIKIDAVGQAALDIKLDAKMGGLNNFPDIRADLAIDWTYALGQTEQQFSVGLTDVELDLGGFFGGFVGKVLGEVKTVLEPIRPIIDFLSEPLPVVSKLAGGDITMLDLLKLQGGDISRIAGFIESLREVDNIVRSIPKLSAGRWLNMGGADYDPATKSFTATGAAAAIRNAFKTLTSEFNTPLGYDPDWYLPNPDQQVLDDETDMELGFPILDPSNLIGLLTGQTVDLFTLKLPLFDESLPLSMFFPLPIFPAVGVELGGAVSAKAEFSFGFDTSGFEKYQKSGHVEDIFDGFYVFDLENPSSGKDISEIQLKANITAAGALKVPFLHAAVGGGLFASIDFNLHDNNNDGKIRMLELVSNTLLGVKDLLGPIHIFDVSGKLDAGLFATIELGEKPFLIEKNFDIAKVNLFNFDLPRPAGEGIQLAQCSFAVTNSCKSGILELNIGANANRRGLIFNTDVAEDYNIYAGSEPNSIIIEAFGLSQIYTGVTKITGSAGAGNDKIVVSKDVLIPVDLSGGPGDDLLIGGSGNDVLSGDDGNDDLRGGAGNDSIKGVIGRDSIRGEDGDDQLYGGTEDDTLDGGDGQDAIFGNEGSDTIQAGYGEDVVYAGAGFDIVYGEGGNDTLRGEEDGDQLEGGDGDDTVWGGLGDDQLFGNDGNDELRGDAGSDVVYGGTGNDDIYGGDGNDRLYGENSRDTIYGGSGNDVLAGGLGADALYGGTGNDKLYANTLESVTGAFNTQDAAGHLLVGGSGDDLIYASPLIFDNTIYGDGVNDELGTLDSATDGKDEIHGGDGIDNVSAGGGDDTVYAAGGNDIVDAASGNDKVFGGIGNDLIIGGAGDDQLYGEVGNDVVWGGLAFETDMSKFDVTVQSRFDLPPRFATTEDEELYHTGYSPLTRVTPRFLAGLSVPGIEGDGRDLLVGDVGNDFLFGGSDTDVISGDDDADYIDAGAGNDINVDGGAGDDVIRGGSNNDVLHGGIGIDHILGDDGDDQLYGDAGTGTNQSGQRLFGGAGADVLYAFAPGESSDQFSLTGDQLFGDADGDTLNGSVRQEKLVGGAGDDLLRGDYLKGVAYLINTNAATFGADDLLRGEGGEDKLYGGGGDDVMWGGSDTDYFDGQQGSDKEYGGSGIDLFVASAMIFAQTGDDIIDGHYGDSVQNDTADDSTDILVINGSELDDVILLSQEPISKRLRIDYKEGNADNRQVFVTWLASQQPVIEQFQVAGLGGSDTLGFAGVLPAWPIVPGSEKLDLSKLSARSQDWIATLEGNSGGDTLIGSSGRDRASGGPGSDTIYGFAGDDRLLGDNGDGFTSDSDTLYGGQGNDDLEGGQGINSLFAWSMYPSTGNEFGIFTDQSGALYDRSGVGRTKENTGLNRMLGNVRADSLYGGTGLDFMYGRGGGDKLYRADGTTFESMGISAGDEWKAYARETGQVWYVGGTNADDDIAVNFVTEPGLLSDHHLITRSTNNNGNFSFSAQVRLDFSAKDSNGNLVWTPDDLLVDFNALRKLQESMNITDQMKVDIARHETNLIKNLLPSEGDFQAIIVDALDGNDKVTIGPTVQKSVWIDAGPGDDDVRILGGNAILVDKAESGQVNGLSSRNDENSQAFTLAGPVAQGIVTGATNANPIVIATNTTGLTNGQKVIISGITGNTNANGTFFVKVLSPTAMELYVDSLLTVRRAGNAAYISGGKWSGSMQAYSGTSFGADGLVFHGLTMDSAADVDWFRFTLANAPTGTSQLQLVSGSPIDGLSMEIHPATPLQGTIIGASNTSPITITTASAASLTSGQSVTVTNVLGNTNANGTYFLKFISSTTFQLYTDAALTVPRAGNAAYTSGGAWIAPLVRGISTGEKGSLSLSSLNAGTPYLLKVTSPNVVPTIYDLRFNLSGTTDSQVLSSMPVVEMGVRSNSERRDIILGGTGNDVLVGGPGEDWVLGGTGNDVISGGLDRLSGDLLLGEDGDDTFQIIPDRLPRLGNQTQTLFDPQSQTFMPTTNDEIDGGPGEDRMLFAGGNLDRRGFAVPDFAALRYNTGLHRYEFSSLVWDIGQQKFMADPNDSSKFVREYLYYQTHNVEDTQIDLQGGNDSFHADPSYIFPGTTEEWGIKPGNYQQGARAAAINIAGGNGDDELFGGAQDDSVSGGPGSDLIWGSVGNDDLRGDGGNDTIFGLKDYANEKPPRSPGSVVAQASFGFSEAYQYTVVSPFFALPATQRPGVDLAAPRPIVQYSFDTPATRLDDSSGRGNMAIETNLAWASTGLVGGAMSFTAADSVLRIGTNGVNFGAAWTASAWFKGFTEDANDNVLFSSPTNSMRVVVMGAGLELGVVDINNTFYASGFKANPSAWKGQWHQITAVGMTNGTQIFFDGVLVGTSSYHSMDSIRGIGGRAGSNSRFADQLDEVYVFNQALTADQVSQLYQTTQKARTSVQADAFALEGSQPGEQLSDFRKIGDFNGDGRDDFYVSGTGTASNQGYILFGPVDLKGIARIDQYADIVVDHNALGTPAKTFGYVNDDDRFSDLAFVRKVAGVDLVTIVLGGQVMATGKDWPRQWDSTFVTGSVNANVGSKFRTINFLGASLASSVDVHILRLNADNNDDVVVVANTTSGAGSIVAGQFDLGYVFSGAKVSAQSSLTLSDQIAYIRSAIAGSDVPSIVAGDINGNGLSELLWGGKLVNSEVTSNTPAQAIATNPPNTNGTLGPFSGITPLSIVLNGVLATINVEFDKTSALNTPANLVAKINTLLNQTSLAGKVAASVVGQKIGITAVQTGDDVILEAIGLERRAANNSRVPSPLGFKGGTEIKAVPPSTTSLAILNEQTTTSTIQVTNSNIIESLEVGINIDHTNVGDLEITLISPDGTSVKLFAGEQTGVNLRNTIFDDTSSRTIEGDGTVPFTGTYRPLEPLSKLRGKTVFGDWKLVIRDRSLGDEGTLLGWHISHTSRSGDRGQGATQIVHSAVSQSLQWPGPIDGPYQFSLSQASVGAFSPVALLDLNNDGFEDFASVLSSQLNVFYGSSESSALPPASIVVQGTNMTATSGDFNGDREMDLAVAEKNGSTIAIFNSVSKKPKGSSGVINLALNQADVIVQLGKTFALDLSKVPSSVDVNGDRIDDLIVNDGLSTSVGGNTNAGRLYAVYGAYKRVPSPNSAIVDLENFSVPGSGSYVVDTQTGQSQVFTNAGNPYSIVPNEEKWFRFTTLGDGRPAPDGNAANAIRVLTEGPVQPLVSETEPNNSNAQAQNLENAIWSRRADANIEQPLEYAHASVRGTGDGSVDWFTFKADAGSRVFIDIDANNFDSRLELLDPSLINVASNDNGFGSTDLQSGPGASFMDLLVTTSGTYYVGVSKKTAVNLAIGDRYILHVSVENHSAGTIADLMDSSLGLLAANKSAFDMRYLAAGTYYLRVHDSVGSFKLEFDAPTAGQFAESATLPDRDRIDGGDGDDTLTGNNDIDRIFGGSGNERFTAENFELHDLMDGEEVASSAQPIAQEFPPTISQVVSIPNNRLAAAISRALGLPVTSNDGQFIMHHPLYASQLNSITSLNASGLELTALVGLDKLTNLQHLDLSDNKLSSRNFEVLAGMTSLNSLDITNNIDIQYDIVGSLSALQYLFMEGINNQFVPEVEPNNTAETAIDLDSFVWTDTFNEFVELPTTFPHVSIFGSGDGTEDYYSISLAAGAHVLIDLDKNNFDSYLKVTGPNGILIQVNSGAFAGADESQGGPGTSSSWADFTVPVSGIYTLELAALLNGPRPIPLGGAYFLHVSASNHVFNSVDDLQNLAQLEILTIPILGLDPVGQNLTAFESTTQSIHLTTASAGAWSVRKPDGTVVNSCTVVNDCGSTISFLPSVAGVYRISHMTMGEFPFFVQNVAPVITGPSEFAQVNEGSSNRLDDLLTQTTVVDPGALTTRQVTITDPSGLVTDLTKGSLRFSDDIVRLNSAILDGATNVTLAFWLNTTSTGLQTVLSAGNSSSSNALRVRVFGNHLFVDADDFFQATEFSTTLSDGQWHHLVITRNADTGTWTFYRDGLLERTIVAGQQSPFKVSANRLMLGQGQNSVGNPSPFVSLSADLGEFSIFRRELVSAQVLAIYHNGVVGNESDLALYLPMKELGGDILHDRSPFARDGVIASNDATPITFTTSQHGMAVVDASFTSPIKITTFSTGDLTNGQAVTLADVRGNTNANGSYFVKVISSTKFELYTNAALTLPRFANAIFTGGGAWSTTKTFKPVNEGNYKLSMTVFDPQGASDYAEATIHVMNVAPTAVVTLQSPAGITGNAFRVTAGQALKFDGLSSTDPGPQDVLSYEWNVTTNNLQTFASSNNSEFEFTPTIPGQYLVELKVFDSAGDSSLRTIEVNVDPLMPKLNPRDGSEGDVFVFDATGVSERAANATRTYLWIVRRDTEIVEAAFGDEPKFAFEAPDNATYSVEFGVRDGFAGPSDLGFGSTTTTTTTITTTNRVPVVDFGPDSFAVEGSTLTFTPRISDAHDDNEYGYSWYVGTRFVSPDPTLSYTFTDNGTYTITLTVGDKDGGQTNATTQVIISNAAPTVDAQIVTLDAEPNNSLATAQSIDTANWSLAEHREIEQSTALPHVSIIGTGDGTTDFYRFTATAGSRGLFDIDHNNFNTTLTLYRLSDNSVLAANDDLSGSPADSTQGTSLASFIDYTFLSSGEFAIGVRRFGADVNLLTGNAYTLNISLENHALASDRFEGQIGNHILFSANANDVGPADDPLRTSNAGQTITWDFGDGSTLQGVYTPTHFYADSGNYHVTATIKDKDGGVAVSAFDVVIRNKEPVDLSLVGPTASVKEGLSVSFTGSVTDWNGLQGGSIDLEPLQAQIDFGDGVILPVVLVPPSVPPTTATTTYTFSVEHIYAKSGPHTAKLSVLDDDGGESTATFGVTIIDATPPTVVATPVTPNPRNTSLDKIELNFGETIVNLDLTDFVLKRNGNAVSFGLQVLEEVEPNNAFATAQNIDAGPWTNALNSSISQSTTTPHVTIVGTGNDTFDFYMFTATANSQVTFDVDENSFPFSIRWFDPAGTFIVRVLDDATFTIPTNGVYVVSVSAWDAVNATNLRVPPGAAYKLHVSLENHTYATSTPAFTDNGGGSWTVGNLQSLTGLEGNYELLLSGLGSGVKDPDNNPLANDLAVRWTTDLTAPVTTVDALTTINRSPRLTGTIDDRFATVKVSLGSQVINDVIISDGRWSIAAGVINPLGIGTHPVTVEATDIAGNKSTLVASNALIIASASNLHVSQHEVTGSTVAITFDQPLDLSSLNLYDGVDATIDTADVTLIGANVGAVPGSLMWDSVAKRLTFVKTGGVLAPDSYTLRLSGGANGIKLTNGELLDGDNDGLPGGDYVKTFGVAASTERVVSIADFARGATSTQGQIVNVSTFETSQIPQAGIPITISDGADVLGIDLDVVFDRQLLDVSSAFVTVLPANWSTTVNIVSDGRVRLTMHSTTPLPAGGREIARILASVPANTPYGAAQLVLIENLAVFTSTGGSTAVPSIADPGLHKAIFVGDTNADGLYTAQDASWIATVRTGLVTGFDAYPWIDPVIIADVTRSGSIDALDSSWVVRKGLSAALQPQIPDLPAGSLTVSPGNDPTLNLGSHVKGVRGSSVAVPLSIVDSATGLWGVDAKVTYDSSILELLGGLNGGSVDVGAMFSNESDWTLDSFVDQASGVARVALYRSTPSTSTAGEVSKLRFNVKPTAPLGTTPLGLDGYANVPPFSFTFQSGSIDVVDNAPTDINLSGVSIRENMPAGATIGTLTTITPDGTGEFTYILIGGVGGVDNDYFSIQGSTLKAAFSFDFEDKSSYSIRVRTTDALGANFEKIFTISILDLPELVLAPVLGDGTNQRSQVKQIVLRFDSTVTLEAGAISLVRRGTNQAVPMVATQTVLVGGQAQIVLSFSGSLTRAGGALLDGYYELTIDGSKIRRGAESLDINGDGIGGDTKILGSVEADNFFALYGDTNGDGLVGVAEFGQFRTAFGKQQTDASYNSLFDFEADGVIGISDFGQFRSRFGKPKPPF